MKSFVYIFVCSFLMVSCVNLQAQENTTQASQNNQEKTLSIIKPDAVQANHIGEILARFEKSGLRIAGIKMTTLTSEQAKDFYKEHSERPFYKDLVDFMTSGPVVIIALEGPDAIKKNRQLMGATDPSKAEKGTIRADLAQSKTKNAVHGSDSQESASREILFFFKDNELIERF